MIRQSFLLIALFIGCSASLSAKKGESIFDRWSGGGQQRITLRFNLDSLLANRNSLDEIEGTIIDSGLTLGVDISVRGRYRRRTCALPPLMLQINKAGLRLAGLNTHNDYKLVTHCTCDPAGQEAVLREQLAYALYRTVDPNASFRTQLLTVDYVNTADGSVTTSYAILIEDTDELKGRLDADYCKDCYNAPLDSYANVERLTLFQYMIGNSDYSTQLVRNLKVMRDTTGRLTAVPYDFDYSTLVNPSYAKQRLVGRTLVWKFEEPLDLSAAAAAEFLFLQGELLQQVADFDQLEAGSRRDITKYLKSFFRELKYKRVGR